MQVNIEWFESLCQELSKNPAAATKNIELFRESDIAVDACRTFLQSNQLSHIAQFQAVSVLHIAFQNRWLQYQKRDHDDMRNMLCGQISECVSKQQQGVQIPQYLINKIVQVFVSFSKRSWIECEKQEKDQFFQYAALLLKTSHQIKYGTTLLRNVLEEFSTKTFAEINLSYDHHLQIKSSFQSNDLQRVFVLTIESISLLFQSLSESSGGGLGALESHFLTLSELVKLLIEVVSWDFSNASSVARAKEEEVVSSNSKGLAAATVIYNKLPRAWAEYLIQPTFIDSIYGMYSQLLQYRSNLRQRGAGPNGDLEDCLLESRNLILCLASINGDIFASPAEQIAMASYMVDYSIKLVSNPAFVLSSGAVTALSITSEDYEEGGARFEELDLFVSTVFRLLNNFKVPLLSQMHNFTAMLVTLTSVSTENASELRSISKFMMDRVGRISGSQNLQFVDDQLEELQADYDIKLLDTWRGEVLNSSLDIWSLLLEDSTVLSILSPIGTHDTANSSSSSNSSSGSAVNGEFQRFFAHMSTQLFPVLLEAVMNVYIFESVLTAEEVENEEEELIESRTVQDVLRGVCMVGRVSFSGSLTMLSNFLTSTISETTELHAKNSAGQGVMNKFGVLNSTLNLISLEKLRITVLFVSYLLVDNYHESAAEVDHESSTINSLILNSLQSAGPQTLALLNATLSHICSLLQFQMSVLVSPNGVYNDLLSPTVLHLVFRFATEYIVRYVDADLGNYSHEVYVAMPQIQNLHGDEFNSVIDLILSAAQHILLYLPLETELVVSIAETLTTLANTKNSSRLSGINSLPSVVAIAEIVTNQFQGGAVQCRLNATGNTAVFESLGSLFVKAKNETYFTQLCTSIYTQLTSVAVAQGGGQARAIMERALSCLCGVARCPLGLDPVLHSLFDSSLPILKSAIHRYLDSDEVLKLYLCLLKDYAENQLSRLGNNSCFELYKACFELLQLYAKRFAMSDLNSANMAEESVHFKSESCLYLLELLNHLSSKDFSFSEDSSEAYNRSFEEEVSSVLLFGLQVMTPVISIDILRSFPVTADKYFSFVAFVCSTYVSNLVKWLNSLPPNDGRSRLFDILQHLLWGPGSIDGSTARQALQALQSLGINEYRSKQNPTKTIGLNAALHAEMLLVTDRLLEVVLLPQGRDHDLSWDRIDALGNTFISFIALDTSRFQQVGSGLVGRHSQQAVQQALLEGLTKLSTNRGVNLSSVEKGNRQLFVQNFREFVVHVKSLNVK